MLGKYYPDDDAQRFAAENLGETDARRDEAIAELRKWIQDNPQIRARTDEDWLLAFLRGCKFDLEKARTKIRNFYRMKTERPEWFRDRDPVRPEIKELTQLGVFVPLRKRHENRLVVVIRTAAHDPRRHVQDDVFKAGKMILDVAVREHFQHATIYGVCAVFDMQNVSLGHARQLPPSVVRKAVFAWQNYHCRPKQLEFVNAPVYINVVLNVFKSFMSEKLKSRIRVHFSGIESLHEVIPKEILPVEYGGSEGTLHELIEYWDGKLLENREWFKEDEQYKTEIE